MSHENFSNITLTFKKFYISIEGSQSFIVDRDSAPNWLYVKKGKSQLSFITARPPVRNNVGTIFKKIFGEFR